MRDHYDFSVMKGIKNPYVENLKQSVKTYEFKLVLKDSSELSDDQCDSLHKAGCDDGTIVSRGGSTFIYFSRDADSLEDAIHTATSAVRGLGFQVEHVEVPCPV